MSEISPELVERMVALLRKSVAAADALSVKYPGYRDETEDLVEARAIVALLPQPADPDLQRVHQIAQENGVTLTETAAKAIAVYFRGRINV